MDVVMSNINGKIWIFFDTTVVWELVMDIEQQETYGDIFKQLAIRKDIVKVKVMLFDQEPIVDNRIVLPKAQAELKRYLSIKEQYWKQKARMTWFDKGDRNTRFFHNHVNGKRKKLQLKRIQKGDGVWVESQHDMSDVAIKFYQRQFTKEVDPTDFTLLDNVPDIVTMEQNLELCRYPTLEEVKAIVFELSGESTSGPDGFTGTFYQEC
ncbi:uncharacterized protein [Nicotiana tomentosiformis]|uniref:uncharacterized protein n=1 Tax=Nicotiana tomentosiformis TaxID=4098 RepID=UPI00388C8D3C